MIRLTIRWRVIFAPWCWLTRHLWYGVQGVHATDESGYTCTRCARWVSLTRCTCGHAWTWHADEAGAYAKVGLSYCRHRYDEECPCAAFVSEAYEAGAHV